MCKKLNKKQMFETFSMIKKPGKFSFDNEKND